MRPLVFIMAIFLWISLGHGQILRFLLSQETKSLTGNLTRGSETDFSNVFDGDIITNIMRILISILMNVAKTYGAEKTTHDLLNDNFLATKRDDFVKAYNLGRRSEDCRLSIVQMIAKYGYPVETHETVTQDGYVLTLFRIPSDGPVVFLMHGLSGSADDFVTLGPDNAIAYLLAKDGYDVWLGNARGTKHSLKHVHLKPSQNKFWDFSWHEIGYYDLPANIDYILNVTGQAKLKYIGHSQGTTSFWVMGSERPEYNDKVSLMIALAPTAFLYNIKSPILRALRPTIGVTNDFLLRASPQLYMRQGCGGTPLRNFLVNIVLPVLVGFNLELLDTSTLPIIVAHAPSGCSLKQNLHYGQGIILGKFRKFNYGFIENLRRYGSPEPPDYALNNVRTPVAMCYGDLDWLSNKRDVETLSLKLPNVIEVNHIEHQNYSHLDYIFAKNLETVIFKRIRILLSRF